MPITGQSKRENGMENEGTELAELEVMAKETQAVTITNEIKAVLIRDLSPVANRMQNYTEFAANIKVSNEVDAARATAVVKEIDADLKLVRKHDVLSGITSGLDRLHKRAVAFRSLFIGPMERDKKAIRQPVMDWEAAEKRKAAELAAKLNAESEAKAALERAKEEAKARRQREIEAEATRKAEEARRAAAEAQGAERARLQAEANAADRKAAAANIKAEARTEAAAATFAPVVHVEAPKSGIRTARAWKVTDIDYDVFFKALAECADLRGFVEIKTSSMERAKAANTSAKIPGVVFEQITR